MEGRKLLRRKRDEGRRRRAHEVKEAEVKEEEERGREVVRSRSA